MIADERTHFELEYWRALLADLSELNDLIGRAADSIVELPWLMLQVTAQLPVTVDAAALVAASTRSRETMEALRTMQGPLGRMGDLVDGHVKALLGQ